MSKCEIVPLSACLGGGLSWIFIRYGKRKALMLQTILTIVGSGLQMFRAYQAFIAGRAIMGFGFGMANAVSPMFITEISPKNMRGVLISFVALWINIGLLVPIGLNFLLPVFIKPNSGVPGY